MIKDLILTSSAEKKIVKFGKTKKTIYSESRLRVVDVLVLNIYLKSISPFLKILL